MRRAIDILVALTVLVLLSPLLLIVALVVFVESVWSVDLAGAEAGLDGVPAGEVAGADGAGRLRRASPLVWPPLPGITAIRTWAMASACSGTATPG